MTIMLTLLIVAACLLPLRGILAENEISCSDPEVPYHGYRNGSCCSYGDRLTYHCEENYELIGIDFIFCGRDGNWTASPPRCRLKPSFRRYAVHCYINNSNFPGIVFSQHGRYGNGAAISPRCQEGYKLPDESKNIKIMCYKGIWIRPILLCTLIGAPNPYVPDLKPYERELNYTWRPKLLSTTNSVRRIYLERNTSPVTKSPDKISTPAAPHIDNLNDCFCTYNNADPNLVAYSGQRKLKYGEKIQKGSTVNFRCRIIGYRRLKGPAELSCRNCTWHLSEFPTCVSPKKGEPIITMHFNHPDDFTFSPSGIRYVKPHVDINITCSLKQANELIRLSGPRKELIPT